MKTRLFISLGSLFFSIITFSQVQHKPLNFFESDLAFFRQIGKSELVLDPLKDSAIYFDDLSVINKNLFSEIDTTPPHVTITSPSDSAVFFIMQNLDIITLVSDAESNIDSAEFFVNQTKIGADKVAPYKIEWAFLNEGTYGLAAVATNNIGLSDTSEVVWVKIKAPVAPAIIITNPGERDCIQVNETVTLSADASDEDGYVSSVRFSVNGNVLVTETEPPFEFEWQPSDTGMFFITALATDNDGITASASVNLTIGNNCMNDMLNQNTTLYAVIYPNPVKTSCLIDIISSNEFESISYSLNDILGKTILRGNFIQENEHSFIEVDMSAFPDGLYLIKISSGNSNHAFTLIKE
jgi:hypothetical protein